MTPAGGRRYRDPVREIVRYRSPDEDSARWLGFEFREGDIVISTRSKSGTTWVQMICGLLVFQTPELPDSLGQLSPWLDWVITPRDEIYALLAAQSHRRFIKTHTPLDGLPIDLRATYIVVGRHPLDMAVSLYHHSHNIDRPWVSDLTGSSAGADRTPQVPIRDWLRRWIDWDGSAQEELDSLPGVMWHHNDAWSRRTQPNVHLVHYDELREDLDATMRRLAAKLEIDVPEERWQALVAAAGFDQMRARADELVDPHGVLKDRAKFFRRGISGAGLELLSPDELRRYLRRAESLAPPDLLEWLHRTRPSRDGVRAERRSSLAHERGCR